MRRVLHFESSSCYCWWILYRFCFYADKRPENLFIKRSIVFSPIIFCGSATHVAIGFLFSFWIEWNIAYLIGLVAFSGFVHISFHTHLYVWYIKCAVLCAVFACYLFYLILWYFYFIRSFSHCHWYGSLSVCHTKKRNIADVCIIKSLVYSSGRFVCKT